MIFLDEKNNRLHHCLDHLTALQTRRHFQSKSLVFNQDIFNQLHLLWGGIEAMKLCAC